MEATSDPQVGAAVKQKIALQKLCIELPYAVAQYKKSEERALARFCPAMRKISLPPTPSPYGKLISGLLFSCKTQFINQM